MTKLQSIAELASQDLIAFIAEAEDKLSEAWDQAVEEGALNETKPKLRIGFSIALDLDAETAETSLSFGVRHKLSREWKIPDDQQLTIELEKA